MTHTIPNKESVRRICMLHGATDCYLLVDTDNEFVQVLSNIDDDKKAECLNDLVAWCGMKFQIFNMNSKKVKIHTIKKQGEKILPILNT